MTHPNPILQNGPLPVEVVFHPYLTGVCCINMDDHVSDDKVRTIFETVFDLRKLLYNGKLEM